MPSRIVDILWVIAQRLERGEYIQRRDSLVLEAAAQQLYDLKDEVIRLQAENARLRMASDGLPAEDWGLIPQQDEAVLRALKRAFAYALAVGGASTDHGVVSAALRYWGATYGEVQNFWRDLARYRKVLEND